MPVCANFDFAVFLFFPCAVLLLILPCPGAEGDADDEYEWDDFSPEGFAEVSRLEKAALEGK